MLTIPISPRGTIPPLLSVVVDILAVVALLLHIHSPTKEKSGDLVLTLVWLAMMNIHGVPVTLGSIPGPEVKGETEGGVASEPLDRYIFSFPPKYLVLINCGDAPRMSSKPRWRLIVHQVGSGQPPLDISKFPATYERSFFLIGFPCQKWALMACPLP